MSNETPTYLGDYRLIEPLGRGGMGQVWLAEHVHLHKRYAVKVLPEETAQNIAFVSRFHTEARVMAELEHPNIVRVHNFGLSGSTYYLVMDYVEGPESKPQTLAGRVAASGGVLPEAEVVRLMRQVCEGMAYAHSFGTGGVVHRDLKPANILIDRDGNARIADFGLVKVLGEQYVMSAVNQSLSRGAPADTINDEKTSAGRRMTANSIGDQATGAVTPLREGNTSTGALLGTYDYMSPEQREGRPIDARSDIYALGIIAYSLLTGRKPVGYFKLPTEIKPSLSKQWDGLIKQTLSEDPADRPQTVREFMDRMPGDKPVRRNKAAGTVLLAGLLIACMIGAAGAVYMFLQNDHGPKSDDQLLVGTITPDTSTSSETPIKKAQEETPKEKEMVAKKTPAATQTEESKETAAPEKTVEPSPSPTHGPAPEIGWINAPREDSVCSTSSIRLAWEVKNSQTVTGFLFGVNEATTPTLEIQDSWKKVEFPSEGAHNFTVIPIGKSGRRGPALRLHVVYAKPNSPPVLGKITTESEEDDDVVYKVVHIAPPIDPDGDTVRIQGRIDGGNWITLDSKTWDWHRKIGIGKHLIELKAVDDHDVSSPIYKKELTIQRVEPKDPTPTPTPEPTETPEPTPTIVPLVRN